MIPKDIEALQTNLQAEADQRWAAFIDSPVFQYAVSDPAGVRGAKTMAEVERLKETMDLQTFHAMLICATLALAEGEMRSVTKQIDEMYGDDA